MSGVSGPAPAAVFEGGGCPDVTRRALPDVPVSYPRGELDPAIVQGLVARASDPKRERWLQQVRRTGACRHPVRLRGVVVRGDEQVYSTADEPDGALMGALRQSP
jgi:hypothetical protein